MSDAATSDAPPQGFAGLTTREQSVLRHIGEGLNGHAIGALLGISHRTVEIHRKNAVTKLGAVNAAHAAVLFDRLQRQPAEETAA